MDGWYCIENIGQQGYSLGWAAHLDNPGMYTHRLLPINDEEIIFYLDDLVRGDVKILQMWGGGGAPKREGGGGM